MKFGCLLKEGGIDDDGLVNARRRTTRSVGACTPRLAKANERRQNGDHGAKGQETGMLNFLFSRASGINMFANSHVEDTS